MPGKIISSESLRGLTVRAAFYFLFSLCAAQLALAAEGDPVDVDPLLWALFPSEDWIQEGTVDPRIEDDPLNLSALVPVAVVDPWDDVNDWNTVILIASAGDLSLSCSSSLALENQGLVTLDHLVREETRRSC